MAQGEPVATPRRGLTQDFDAHVTFAVPAVPASPAWANRAGRTRRWFTVAFGESWLAVLLYRASSRLRAAQVPALPACCDVLSQAVFDISIGKNVSIGPGLMMTHGHVVIDGHTRIGADCQINPWVTVGLSNSKKLGFSIDGPRIGDHVHIGTGAKVLGPITIGDYVRIGANAVVVHDVPPNTTVVGIPARPVDGKSGPLGGGADGSGRDQRLASHMRSAIVDYRLHRQSLRSMVDALLGSFEIGSDRLRVVQDSVQDDLIFLDALAATGGEETPQVLAAIDAVDAVLADID
jgi:serine O-acetyltransferase